MKATIAIRDLADGLAIVDHGCYTQKNPAAITVTARCGRTYGADRIEMRTYCPEGFIYDVTLTASIPCDVAEEDEFTTSIECLKKVVSDAKKTKHKLIEFSGTPAKGKRPAEYWAAMDGNSRRVISPLWDDDAVQPVDDNSEPQATVERERFMAATEPLLHMENGRDIGSFGQSVAVACGSMMCTDGHQLSIFPAPEFPADFRAGIPRTVIERLAKFKTWESVRIGGRGLRTSCGRARFAWIPGNHRDDTLANAEHVGPMAQKALKTQPVTVLAEDLARAAKELRAFCRADDSVRLLPHELGIRVLRYDVKYNASPSDLRGACRAETVCAADWPLPAPVTIPLEQLVTAVGEEGESEIFVGADIVAVRRSGGDAVRLVSVAMSPFDELTEI